MSQSSLSLLACPDFPHIRYNSGSLKCPTLLEKQNMSVLYSSVQCTSPEAL